ncbi:MAG: sugar ABC transporter permease [Defluviitaleaceae bacterium]|nr:sugar ABC transporter permease [Defluviitaleaceae bacterium]
MGKAFSFNRLKSGLVGWGFILIPVILVGVFIFYPMFRAFQLSLQTGIGRRNLVYIDPWYGNYARLIQDSTFWTALQNNFFYLIIQVPIMIVLAMTFAVLLNKKDLRFRGFFRTCIFLPAITSLMAYSTVFRYMFDTTNGILNNIMLDLGLISTPIGWLTDPSLARITIIIAITWRWTGYNMIFYLSSLQNVDEGIYEAARIDGANSVQSFFKITVPMLKPIILFTSVMSTIGTLQLFDEVMQIPSTPGGPGNATTTLAQYIFNISFLWQPDFGYAASISFVMLAIILALSAIQFWVTRDRDRLKKSQGRH